MLEGEVRYGDDRKRPSAEDGRRRELDRAIGEAENALDNADDFIERINGSDEYSRRYLEAIRDRLRDQLDELIRRRNSLKKSDEAKGIH